MKKKIAIIILIFTALYAITNSLEINETMLDFIARHTEAIESFIHQNFLFSLLLFFSIYLILLSVGFPMGAIMAMVAGFFYPYETAVLITLVSALSAALLTFFIGKRVLYRYLKKRYTKKITQIEKSLKEDGIYYVLAVRVSSILPFFLVNLFFGAANLSYKNYILPTFVGLIPGTMVYVNIGASLSSLDSLRDIFSVKVAFSFLLLGLLAIMPVVLKKIKLKLF